MKIQLLNIYIKEDDTYGFDLLVINHKSLFSIYYESFFKSLTIELFFVRWVVG
jgi:hypothetical protein